MYERDYLSALFPDATDEEQTTLQSSLENGELREPIHYRMRDGKRSVVDGWQRLCAWRALGWADEAIAAEDVSGKFETEAEWRRYVVDKNIARRHLKASQRAMWAAELSAESTRGRQMRTCAHLTQTEAAELMGVSRRAVQQAKQVAEQAPENIEAVRNGEMSLRTALENFSEPSRVTHLGDPDELRARLDAIRAEKADCDRDSFQYGRLCFEAIRVASRLELIAMLNYARSVAERNCIDLREYRPSLQPRLALECMLYVAKYPEAYAKACEIACDGAPYVDFECDWFAIYRATKKQRKKPA